MPRIDGGVKLKHGKLTKIARRRKLSSQHVSLVAKGERDGSDGLVKAILREQEKEAAEQQAA